MKSHLAPFFKPLIAASLALGSMGAQASSFQCVNLSNDCTQAGVSVTSWSLAGNVLTISNASAANNLSAITGISFDTSAGQSVALAASQGAGVLYTTGGGANLPASLGWTIDFEFKPDTKPMANGINAGESLSFVLSGVTLNDIQSGAFRFGIHVQGLSTPAGSEKLTNITVVPEPESVAMVLAGLGLVAGVLRRRSTAAR